MSNIHYFEITFLLFKIRTKIGVRTLAKPHAIFQSFLLEMLGFIHSFTTGKFNPKLSSGFEARPNGVLHIFSLTKFYR